MTVTVGNIIITVLKLSMSELFLKYYYDVTKYNIYISILVIIFTQRLYAGVISFGTFGMVGSFFVYRYYQNIEYYFYLNAGLSKRGIILKTFKINFIISATLSIILWSIH